MVTLNKIQEKIQQSIKNSNLTQTELGNKIGIGQQTISEYVRGKSLPALDTFANLCAVLDLDANEILCIRDWHFK